MKSEPDSFSWAQHAAAGTEPWTGVRNHAAKNNLAAMRLGERALFYHSGVGREIVGVAEVVREAYPDPTAEPGPWLCVDLRALSAMPRPVSLAQIRAEPALAGMALVRLSRLSVGPVSEAEWRHVCAMGGWAG